MRSIPKLHTPDPTETPAKRLQHLLRHARHIPPNPYENDAYRTLHQDGWTVFAKGFPDLLAVKYQPGGYPLRAKWVEVKGPNGDVQGHQHSVLRALAATGHAVEVHYYETERRRRVEPYTAGDLDGSLDACQVMVWVRDGDIDTMSDVQRLSDERGPWVSYAFRRIAEKGLVTRRGGRIEVVA